MLPNNSSVLLFIVLLLFEKLFSIGSCRSGLRPCSGGLPLCFLPAPEGCVWASREDLEGRYALPGAFKAYRKVLLG